MSASILAAAPVSHLPTTTAVRRASLLPTPRPRTHLHPPSHSSHRNSTTDANNIQGPHRSYTHATTAAARRASLRPPAGGPGMKQPPPAHSPYPDPPPPKQESHKPRVTSVKRQGGQEVKTSEGKTFWLTDEEYEYYKEAFNIFDRDHSGAIDIEELGAVMLSIGLSPTQDELLSMIDKVDADSTGTVEFDEFLQMSHEWMIQGRLDTTDQLWEAFELLDLDQNGFISLSDLKRVIDSLKAKGEGVDNMADEDIQDMIKEFDLDGDGKVGFEDFLAMMAEK